MTSFRFGSVTWEQWLRFYCKLLLYVCFFSNYLCLCVLRSNDLRRLRLRETNESNKTEKLIINIFIVIVNDKTAKLIYMYLKEFVGFFFLNHRGCHHFVRRDLCQRTDIHSQHTLIFTIDPNRNNKHGYMDKRRTQKHV